MDHKEIYQSREEISKISERTKNYFIEIASSMGIRESFTIQDENHNVILKGSNLIPKGMERFSMIGFVGGVFLPVILMFALPFLGFSVAFDIMPILFFLFIPWAIGYTIVFNILINRFRRTYKFQDANGLSIGELKGNMSVSNWKIIDSDGANRATLQFPRIGKEEFFTLDTPDGRYTAYYKYKKHLGGAIRSIQPEMFKEVEVMDSSGVLAFTLLNYGQIVQSEEVLSSLITLLSGTCVVIRLVQLSRQAAAI
ncbi:MAG: hypothetical protein ACFE95_04330 [Candidatus Hodarchaeota archaeon]